MAWIINQDRNTGGWYVENTDTGKKYYNFDPGAAINDAIRLGDMPASNRAGLLADATAIVERQNSVQPSAPPLSAPVVGQTETPPAVTGDQNTDPETKTLNQTQGTDGETEPPAPNNAPAAQVTAGAGADDDNPQTASDTSPNVTTSGSNAAPTDLGSIVITESRLNTPGVISPKGNILDKYASYTWSASLYLMSSDQFSQFMTSKKKNLTGYNLLIQSGGAPVNKTGFVGNLQTQVFYENNGVTTTATANAGRSPAFPLDFYIDNISIVSQLNGKGTNQAHGTVDLKFQITEPNGLTLFDRLYQAVQDAAPRNANGPIDYQQAQYLLVIRWYGFDEDGNPAKPPRQGPDTRTDPRSIIEKFVPFTIRNIAFTVSNRLVTYDFDCAPVGQLVAGTSRSGTVTSDVELTGKTVKDVLVGNAAVAATRGGFSPADVRRVDNELENNTAPSPASGAPILGSTTAVGLIQAMNSWQAELVKTGTREYADTYEIVFAPGSEAIQNAEVNLLESLNAGATPMGTPASSSPASLLTEKQAVGYNGRNLFVTAGTQMLYAIDQIIRNSSYISNQATVGASEENNPYINKDRASTKPVQWYNISMEVIPDGSKYDRKVNSPVYKIRYVINAYTVQNFVSRFFPTIAYLGVHKSYPYWFTGQNTAVLDYQASFNRMYQLIVSGSTPNDNYLNTLLKGTSASMRDQLKWYVAPRSNQSTAGAENRGYEIPSEAAEYLYDPTSLATAKVRIIGDPAWIQQGALLGSSSLAAYGQPFMSDGTINFDGGQPMFEIAWQKPQDYDIATGLADPYKTQNRNPVQSFVYNAYTVTSEFRGGRFEQVITGSLYPFPKPDGSNTVAPGQWPSAGAGQQTPGFSNQDPRRVDSESGGVDAQGRPLKTQPGVNNSNGTRPAPAVSGAVSPGGGYDGDDSGTLPADVATGQPPPEIPNSDGTDVAWFDYEPPPKLGSSGDNADPPQTMALET